MVLRCSSLWLSLLLSLLLHIFLHGSCRGDNGGSNVGVTNTQNLTNTQLFVVICRYLENITHLGWLEAYPHAIYDRGENLPDNSSLNIISHHRNVGRESYIYLEHIINNYDNLANITIFSQAMMDQLELTNYTNEAFRRDVEGFATQRLVFQPGKSYSVQIVLHILQFYFAGCLIYLHSN